MDAAARQLLDHLRAREDAMRALLEDLVRYETPSHAPETMGPLLDRLGGALGDVGARCRRVAGRRVGDHLLAVAAPRRRHAPYQLLIGHCDTVWPVGTLDGDMPLTLEDRKLRGPGAYDMKTGLVQLVFALEALQAMDVAVPVTPVILVNSDEEIGSPESGRWIRRLANGADRALVLEPSLGPGGRLKTARKGIGRFTVKVHGRAAHAGLDPEKGASAILELTHVVQSLFALNDPTAGVTVNVGMIDGGLRPNVVAPMSEAVADVRVLTHEDAERIEAAIHGLEPTTPGTRLEIEGHIGRPPMEPTDGNRRLWALVQDAARALDLEVDEGTAGGGSDANTTSQFTPTIDGLGAVGDGAHARHEFVNLEHLVHRTALLSRVLACPPLSPAAPGAAPRPEEES